MRRRVAGSTFAQILRQRRLERGLTQQELAERARLSARAISDLERGVKRAPRLSTVRLLAQAMDLGPEEAAALLAASRESQLVAVAQGQATAVQLSEDRPTPVVTPHGRIFVGRERELQQLQAALARASGGQSELAIVAGEPGIGKSALCEQLVQHATSTGARPLVGHCYAESSRSMAYLPFVEALTSYVSGRGLDALRADVGQNALALASMVPEVAERLQVDLPSQRVSEDDRWRLWQGVAGLLRNAARAQPLLLVLEDLHDADRATLDLLVNLVRNLTESRVLIVGTYRDLEVDHKHPLSTALAQLRRTGYFERVRLRGLTADEVHLLLRDLGFADKPGLADVVYRRTEGNPLFVHEVVRLLAANGPAGRARARGSSSAEWSSLAGVPDGLREMIALRLSRLSDEAKRVLRAAAVIGPEFRLDVLQQLMGPDEEAVYAALEEAVRDAVLEERVSLSGEVTYRFSHALFRQTLYEELLAPRRMRLHQQAARVLEQVYAEQAEEHAAELAEHYAYSAGTADRIKAVSYAELAARRATGAYAYDEAARHLERALHLQQAVNPDDWARRCELLLSLGEALLPLERPRHVVDTVVAEAFTLAEAHGAAGYAARTAVQALGALERAGGGPSASPAADVGRWLARADAHAAVGTIERIYTDLYQGIYAFTTSTPAQAHVFLRRAVERARDVDDERVFLTATGVALHWLRALPDLALVEDLLREFQSRSHASLATMDLATSLVAVARILLSAGERLPAERAWHELAELADRSRDLRVGLLAGTGTIAVAFLDGRLEEVISLVEAQKTLATDIGHVGYAFGAGIPAQHVEVRALAYLGRDVEPLLAHFAGPEPPVVAARALVLSYLGRLGEALAVIREELAGVGAADDETAPVQLLTQLEVGVLCRDAAAAEVLLRRLAPVARRLDGDRLVSIDRLLGEAAWMLGKPREAWAYFHDGLDVCHKVGFRPEVALLQLDLAELRLAEFPSERAGALQALESASCEFAALGMQPSVDRALRLARRSGMADLDAIGF
jgi:transcriptional regulator with XRE-family HTH domain